jgi:hypothetical protein
MATCEEIIKKAKPENFPILVAVSPNSLVAEPETIFNKWGYKPRVIPGDYDLVPEIIVTELPGFVYYSCADTELGDYTLLHSIVNDITLDAINKITPALIDAPELGVVNERLIEKHVRLAHASSLLDAPGLFQEQDNNGLFQEFRVRLSSIRESITDSIRETVMTQGQNDFSLLELNLLENYIRAEQCRGRKRLQPEKFEEVALRIEHAYRVLFGNNITRMDGNWFLAQLSEISYPDWLHRSVDRLIDENDLPRNYLYLPAIQWLKEPEGSRTFFFLEKNGQYLVYDTQMLMHTFNWGDEKVQYCRIIPIGSGVCTQAELMPMVESWKNLPAGAVVLKDMIDETKYLSPVDRILLIAPEYFARVAEIRSRVI